MFNSLWRKITLRKISKYIYTIIFSSALLFCDIPKPTIVYNCTGTEMFPTFFGSPFIYKSSSLASSLEYDFYFVGIVANIILWSLIVFLLRLALLKIVSRLDNKWLKRTYQILKYSLTVLCIAWTTLSIYVYYGSFSFQADMDAQSKIWGMTCSGKLYITN